MKHFSIGLVAAALALTSLASPAQADQRTDSGLYIMAGIARAELQPQAFTLEEANETVSRFAGGWMFTPNLGIEASYHSLSDYLTAERGLGSFFESDLTGPSLSAVASWPATERIAFVLKAGLIRWESERGFEACDFRGCRRISFSESGQDLVAGLGVSFELNEWWEAELAYEQMDIDFPDMLNFLSQKIGYTSLSIKLEF